MNTRISRFDVGGTVTDPMAGQQTGAESSLSSWVGPYVTDMLGKGRALANSPYQAYTGPLTAGPSELQSQAFKGLASLTMPAATYSPTSFVSTFTSPGKYKAGNFSSTFTTPEEYDAQTFTTDTWDRQAVDNYMSPYLMAALEPQMAEARRQADISRVQQAGRLAKAGAYGGSRQAIMESELDRNLTRNLSDIMGRGYETGYQQARGAFESDAARKLQTQQLGEQSRQFGYGQKMSAADAAARYAQEAQRMGEQSRQFGYGQEMFAADAAARYAQEAQRMGEQSRQFGANYGLSSLGKSLDYYNTLLGAGATQRGIESEGIAADIKQFEDERDYPYKQVQYMQSLLQGLPLATQSYSYQEPSGLTQLLGGAGGILGFLERMKLIGGGEDNTSLTQPVDSGSPDKYANVG